MSNRNPQALFTLDRPGIRDAFDRASANYESAAVLQAQVNDELVDRSEEHTSELQSQR